MSEATAPSNAAPERPGDPATTTRERSPREPFHDELRQRNARLFLWSALIFAPVNLGWSAFDYLLVPSEWRAFLSLRLGATALTALLIIASRVRFFARASWEMFACWWACLAIQTALMLPATGDQYVPYLGGYTLIVYAAGLLPTWPLRWAATSIGATAIAVPIALLASVPTLTNTQLATTAFLLPTSVGIGLVTAYYKYNLSRADYLAREQLATLDRAKSKFFANISHELRTPLTMILAPIDALIDGADARLRRDLGVIRQNGARLLRLIDELLELSRADAGALRLAIAEFDVGALASSVEESCRPLAEKKSIDLSFERKTEASSVFGDAHRIEMILTNLVGNALKYTPDNGHVRVSVTDAEHHVAIAVADDGPGIPASELPNVFDRFFQIGGGERRRVGGVGIGLALAKELAELHGGRILVESTEGSGTTFTLELRKGRDHFRDDVIERRRAFDPAHAGRRRDDDGSVREVVTSVDTPPDDWKATPLEPAKDIQGARILIVDDHDELRAFMRGIFEPACIVFEARDGAEGLEIVKRERPDLVISDVMMPNVGGPELCRRIKSDPSLRMIPILLLTSRTGAEITLEAYAHGANDFVAKPFHPRVLAARVEAQLRLKRLALQLTSQEKLAAIGTLAAGVAHEVKNPVNSILNGARVLRMGDHPPEKANRLLDIIIDGSKRIQDIVSALETHARPADPKAQICDVRDGIDATLRLLEHKMTNVGVHRAYDDVALAAAPPGPVNQIFLNLIDNAVRSGASNIWITSARSDDRVRVAVKDDGPGIPPDVAARIFDAFFTTRAPGEGTGLGLYLSRKIAAENGGDLTLASHAGEGAEFVLELPSAT